MGEENPNNEKTIMRRWKAGRSGSGGYVALHRGTGLGRDYLWGVQWVGCGRGGRTALHRGTGMGRDHHWEVKWVGNGSSGCVALKEGRDGIDHGCLAERGLGQWERGGWAHEMELETSAIRHR